MSERKMKMSRPNKDGSWSDGVSCWLLMERGQWRNSCGHGFSSAAVEAFPVLKRVGRLGRWFQLSKELEPGKRDFFGGAIAFPKTVRVEAVKAALAKEPAETALTDPRATMVWGDALVERGDMIPSDFTHRLKEEPKNVLFLLEPAGMDRDDPSSWFYDRYRENPEDGAGDVSF